MCCYEKWCHDKSCVTNLSMPFTIARGVTTRSCVITCPVYNVQMYSCTQLYMHVYFGAVWWSKVPHGRDSDEWGLTAWRCGKLPGLSRAREKCLATAIITQGRWAEGRAGRKNREPHRGHVCGDKEIGARSNKHNDTSAATDGNGRHDTRTPRTYSTHPVFSLPHAPRRTPPWWAAAADAAPVAQWPAANGRLV